MTKYTVRETMHMAMPMRGMPRIRMPMLPAA
jgi:hypothetical protein